MQVTHCRIDVGACERAGQRPGAVIDRLPTEEWLVSYDPICMDRDIRWTRTLREEKVWIPLVPYLVLPQADLALAFMVQIGMRVSIAVGRPVQRLHLATGMPVEEELDTAGVPTIWRYWLGLGIVLG